MRGSFTFTMLRMAEGGWQPSLLLLLGACALAGCASTTPIALDAGRVHSPPLHMTMVLPETWRLLSPREVRDGQVRLKSTNQQLNRVLYQGAGMPLVAIGRKEAGRANFLPTLSWDRYPLGEDRFASSARVAGYLLWHSRQVVSATQIIGPILTVRIGTLDFAWCLIQIPLSFPDGREFQVEQQFWVRASGTSPVIITATYDRQDAAAVLPEIHAMLRSVVWEKRGPESSVGSL